MPTIKYTELEHCHETEMKSKLFIKLRYSIANLFIKMG